MRERELQKESIGYKQMLGGGLEGYRKRDNRLSKVAKWSRALDLEVSGWNSSSLNNIILNTFRVVLVLWRLLLQVVLSLSYVIVVQKSSYGD